MERYMIVIPARNRAFTMKCDDGDSMKLETLRGLVGGPIEPVTTRLKPEWAREQDVNGILLLVNEEGAPADEPAGLRDGRRSRNSERETAAGGPGHCGCKPGR